MRGKMMLALIAHRSGVARRRQEGFALLLSLFVGLAVVIGWLMLAARSSSSRLGAALQSENREARLVAESAIDVVINELNQPRNRMLLAQGEEPADWQAASPPGGSPPDARFLNTCNNALSLSPSSTIGEIGKSAVEPSFYLPLPNNPGNDRFSRRFRLRRVTLKNSNRQSGSDYSPNQINLREPGAFGYIELEVEGQVLRNGVPAATASITREYQVVPKCCQRSFRGPGDPDQDRDPITNVRPGLYGNDERGCSDGFPQFLVGTGNSYDSSTGIDRNIGGLNYGITPEVRSRKIPSEKPGEILCFTKSPTGKCDGETQADNVPVIPTDQFTPKAPVLGPQGVPCAEKDLKCIEEGIEKARNGGFTARSIDLINQGDRDYIRLNDQGKVEICDKQASPEYVKNWDELTNQEKADTKKAFDPSTTVIDGSCELMMGNADPDMDVCAEQEIDGFKTYHCRIRNIYVNDTGAGGRSESRVRQNNTLFIDSSNGPIYLYVNEDWAATSLDQASDRVQKAWNEARKATKTHDDYAAIFTPGRYDDGQIQHVYCGPVNGKNPPGASEACATAAPAEITSRAAIVSACRRIFENGQVKEDCKGPNDTNTVNMMIGDDGFVRDLFLFMPNSSITISGDPFGSNEAQGKPQVAAAVWVDRLRFTNRATQLYVPGEDAEFYGLETNPDDKFRPPFFDYIARSITSSSLFRRLPWQR
jgi:hypothetical protein